MSLVTHILARPVNWLIRLRNRVVAGHNARVAEQSRQAVEEATQPSARVHALLPYVVHYSFGKTRRFATFAEAARWYAQADGYGLVYTDRQTDGGNYAGLTDEQREELGL